jgi:hypothetical protein
LEYSDKPVTVQTGFEPEPVSVEPVRYEAREALRAYFDAFSPAVHAQRLLAWLQAKGYGGNLIPSKDVRDNAYPQFCAERDWTPQPWRGPEGVGKHLSGLCGGRPIRTPPGGKPTRCYAIPAAVVELAAAERRRA